MRHYPRLPSRTDGWGIRSSGRRKAVSSGVRAPYLRAGSLRSDTPVSAGACRIEVDQAEGFPREWPEPVAASASPAPFSPEAGGRHDLQPAAFDPHPCPGGLPGHRMRRHRKRRPDKSLPRPVDPPPGPDGRGRVWTPKARTRRNRPGLASSFARRRPAGVRKARSVPHRRGAGDTRQAISSATTGRSPVPRKSGLPPDNELPKAAGEIFLSRAGFWCGSCPEARVGRTGGHTY